MGLWERIGLPNVASQTTLHPMRQRHELLVDDMGFEPMITGLKDQRTFLASPIIRYW
jgi:hypothetical protein